MTGMQLFFFSHCLLEATQNSSFSSRGTWCHLQKMINKKRQTAWQKNENEENRTANDCEARKWNGKEKREREKEMNKRPHHRPQKMSKTFDHQDRGLKYEEMERELKRTRMMTAASRSLVKKRTNSTNEVKSETVTAKIRETNRRQMSDKDGIIILYIENKHNT